MSVENLQDLLKEELKDIYNAEAQILKALPKLIKGVTETDLRDALSNHLEETKGHKQRLERVFDILGMPAKGKTCAGMKGIIDEGDEMVGEAGDSVTDASIIAAAQKVEHYEIASYGCVRTWAQELGYDEVAGILQETLDEEYAADEKLTELAVGCANAAAEAGGSEDEEEEEGGSRRARGGMEEEEEEEESRETAGVRGKTTGAKTGGAGGQTSASRRRDRAKA
jgi:ferritin-like metal-binding protein YciE